MLKTASIRPYRPGRASIVTAALVAVGGLLAACTSSGATHDNEHKQVRFVTAKGAIEWWPVQFALEQGIFKDDGLDLRTIQAKSGPEITSIVSSGSADVGMGVLEAAIVPIQQRAEMTILDIPGITPSSSVIASSDVKLPNATLGYPESATNLKGLKVGVTALGSPSERYLKTVLEDAGLSPDDVTFVAVGAPSTAIPAFTQGKVDALLAYDPLTQLLGGRGYQTVVTADDMIEHATGPASGVYFIGAKEFADSSAAGTFCRAVLRAYEAIQDPANEAAAVKSLTAWTGLSAKQGGAVLSALRKRVGAAEIDDATWRSAEEFLTSKPPAFGNAVTPVCE
jgi:ABC-type nitrate/sulfonate/bicarbonate transport systems, periplasmic components